jgi:uncharacterized protein (DUF983 family)
MRMIPISVVRVLQRCPSCLGRHVLLIFHEVRAVGKTCPQLYHFQGAGVGPPALVSTLGL